MLVQGLLIVLSAASGLPDSSLTDEAVLQQGEAAVRQGLQARDRPEANDRFREAAVHYEELYRRGASNPGLFRDEGNAWLLAGDLPRAILAYRRGLRLAPGDRRLRANLSWARGRVVYPTPGDFGRPPTESWPPGLPRPGLAVLLGLAAALYTLAWVALTRWRMTGRGWLLGAGAACLGAGLLSAGGLALERWQVLREAERPLVVIAADGVLLRKGDGQAYPARYETPLNRGVEARLRFARGDWLLVQLTGGETGWVPRSAVLLDPAD